MVNISKVNAFLDALNAKFENKTSNKKDNISGDFSTDAVSYPTVRAVKNYVSSQISQIGSLILGETSTTAYRGDRGKIAYEHSQVATGNPHNVTKSDVGLSNVSNVEQAPATHLNDSNAHKSLFDTKVDSDDLATVATTGDYDDLSNTPDLSSLGGIVTVEKQTTADSGFTSTYVIKQDGTQVGTKINIPKDYLVKSGSVKTVENANSPVQGYSVGDKYIDFVINTKDSTGSDEHLYILVSDLVDNYVADDSTLELSNFNQFRVKNGGIGATQLSSDVNTKLGYANAFNSSAAKGITSSDISAWNNKSDVSVSDVDDEIDDYLDAIVTALTS